MLVKDRTGQHNYTSQIDSVGQWGAASPPITSRVEEKKRSSSSEGHTSCNSQADRGNRNIGGTENQRAGIQHV